MPHGNGGTMKLVTVDNEQRRKQFLELPPRLYKDDPNYIRPLDKDIERVFNPDKNKYFTHGELERWLLLDDNEQPIGRVAAFINEAKAYTFDQPTGNMGFFECINNQEAADILFNQCKHWLEERGMEAMDGPVNFGERNMWWGMLVEGYDEPCYGMNYNPPWYNNLFSNFGFQPYFYQHSYGMGVNDPRPEKYMERSKKLMQNPDYTFRHFEKGKEKEYAEDFRTIYNKAFGGREGVKPISQEQADSIVRSLKPVLVDYLLWFGYYKDEPIALFFMMPEMNQYLKHVNGSIGFFDKLKLGYHKLMGTVRKMYGFLFGVVPEHQGKGVEGGIIMAANEVVVPKKRWDDLELIWIGDFNVKMNKVAQNLGANIVKRHCTYRYLFDRDKPFKRKPFEE